MPQAPQPTWAVLQKPRWARAPVPSTDFSLSGWGSLSPGRGALTAKGGQDVAAGPDRSRTAS